MWKDPLSSASSWAGETWNLVGRLRSISPIARSVRPVPGPERPTAYARKSSSRSATGSRICDRPLPDPRSDSEHQIGEGPICRLARSQKSPAIDELTFPHSQDPEPTLNPCKTGNLDMRKLRFSETVFRPRLLLRNKLFPNHCAALKSTAASQKEKSHVVQ